MACSVVNTRESRPKTIEAGSLGGPGVNPFHSKEEAEISAVFAGGRCWLRESRRQAYPGRGTDRGEVGPSGQKM